MRTRFLQVLVCLALLALGFTATSCRKDTGSAAGSAKYHCPMHPTYVSDRPGDCPICNMKLVPIKDAKAAPAVSEQKKPSGASGEYACPDHPDFIFDQPGVCGICNKKLEPIHPEGHADHEAAAAGAAGRIAVALSPEKQQLIGLKTSVVAKRELAGVVRASAVLEHDETRQAKIAPRFGGWVQKLFVNFTGQHVEQGEPLFSVYSPELVAAENEYLLARQRLEQLKTNAAGADAESSRRLVESARRRLTLWGVGDEELRVLEQSGQAHDEVLMRAPVSGHVLAKTAVQGKAFMAGETLYELGALSSLWLRALVQESDFPRIKVGQKAKVILPYAAYASYESKVAFLYPHIDPQTRRAQIRLELENPQHQLRPDMWANVEISTSEGEVLVLPASAVIDTGVRHVAFVLREDNHLEPREVKIGARTDDWWEVQAGVKEGEKVVTRALFLVDAESQLKSAISGMTGNGEHQH
ncbi:MAG: efflux RND transporter periplasmic adaptor subunit [Verrucomicrobia bacterium]|nr:efflux RND transporter periplasmic adaptor subunit [Verrucomicrobiota bacterium]